MKKSRFSETQIVSMLKEANAGMKAERPVHRRHPAEGIVKLMNARC